MCPATDMLEHGDASALLVLADAGIKANADVGAGVSGAGVGADGSLGSDSRLMDTAPRLDPLRTRATSVHVWAAPDKKGPFTFPGRGRFFLRHAHEHAQNGVAVMNRRCQQRNAGRRRGNANCSSFTDGYSCSVYPSPSAALWACCPGGASVEQLRLFPATNTLLNSAAAAATAATAAAAPLALQPPATTATAICH